MTGFRRPLGRRVPRLQFVGRVPFGRQRSGRLRIRWDRTVNGRPLPPGRSLITFRALNRRGTVQELAKPATLVIPRRRQERRPAPALVPAPARRPVIRRRRW